MLLYLYCYSIIVVNNNRRILITYYLLLLLAGARGGRDGNRIKICTVGDLKSIVAYYFIFCLIWLFIPVTMVF